MLGSTVSVFDMDLASLMLSRLPPFSDICKMPCLKKSMLAFKLPSLMVSTILLDVEQKE
jgi:hypothetical protein